MTETRKGAIWRSFNTHVEVGIQLAPAFGYLAAFFVGPLILLVLLSFFTFQPSSFSYTTELTFDNYGAILQSEGFRIVLVRTMGLASVAAAIVLIVAYPFAYVATFVFPSARRLLFFLVLAALFGSYLARIYSWRTILGATGVINVSLIELGIIQEPLRFLLNSPFAVALAWTNFLLPVALLPLFAAMQNVSPGVLEAARDLGSGRWDVTRRILLPLTMPGVRVAFAATLIGAGADFATPQLLGGPTGLLLGSAIVHEFGTTLNWPLGAALAMTMIGVLVVEIMIVSALLTRFGRAA
jgi:spermidine/putrescine transport system permease protein